MTLHTPLHKRARALLEAHFDAMSEDDKAYLTSLFNRKIVWGTQMQNAYVERVEQSFLSCDGDRLGALAPSKVGHTPCG